MMSIVHSVSVLPRHLILKQLGSPKELIEASEGWIELRPERTVQLPIVQFMGTNMHKAAGHPRFWRSHTRVPQIALSKYKDAEFLPGQFIKVNDTIVSGDSCEEPVYEENHRVWFDKDRAFDLEGRLACIPRINNHAWWTGGNTLDISPSNDKPVLEIDGPVLNISAWYHSNICHWLIDMFSRLWALPFLGDMKPKILVPKEDNKFTVGNVAFINECLDLLGISENQIIRYHNGVRFKIKELYNVSRLASMYNYIAPECADFYRNLPSHLPSFKPADLERIYISRLDSGARACQNEEELVERLKDYDFHCIKLSEYSIPQRLELFRNAKFVMGPMGAGMAHSLFMPDNTKVLVTAAPEFHNASNMMLNIAAVKSQQVGLISGANLDKKQPVKDRWTLNVKETVLNMERFLLN